MRVFFKRLWRLCRVLGALPPHHLGAVRIRGCVWARPRAGGREAEPAASLRRNGYNVRTLAPGDAQARHCSTPSFPTLAGREGLGNSEGPAWGGGRTAVSAPKPSQCQPMPLQRPPGWAKLLPHPRMWEGGSEFGSRTAGCPATGLLCEPWQVHPPLWTCSCEQLELMSKSQEAVRINEPGNQDRQAQF